ncbi:hypothetical protein [Methylobacterium flocculans]|uniref:hypothetical protein n=1 Tax=Methylobacterium flocculans TaxID=2984843 RepID=UPI0021F30DE4|nr:hypothetical protein [Methylobacterium sp. FF17]
MPSLKLSNPFRRGANRPSLKQRAANLKASAARVMKRKPADPFGDMACPEGFVPYPFDKPMSYASIGHVVIPVEAQKLLDLALDEYERVCGSFADFMSDEQREGIRQANRNLLRLDALAALVAPDQKGASAAPRDDSGTDALLVHLGRQFEAARLAEEAAHARFNKADELADAGRPAKPGSLVFRASDRSFGLRESSMHPDAWEGLEVFHDDIEWMRRRAFTREVWRDAREGERAWKGHGGKLPEIQPYPEAQARAAELVGIWDAWQADCDRAEAEAGVPAASDASMAAFQAGKAIASQIAELPARTAEGLKVKIRALDFYAYSSSKDEPDAILMRSLARDAAAAADSEPFSLQGAASLSFDALTFEGGTRTLPEWQAKLGEYAIAMVLAEHFLKMGKPEMEARIRDIGEEDDGSGVVTILQNFDAAQETFEGWVKLLSTASARYTIASSSLILADNPAAEG